MTKIIGLIAGSLRKASFSKKIAHAVAGMAPAGFTFRIIALDDLPVYNQDFDDHNEVPPSYTAFRGAIGALDGFIFITPEHNRSVPAALKNALDIGSRPYGSNVWSGKAAAVFSNSPGNLGGFGANHHLRQCLVCLGVPTMQQPEVYLAQVAACFDESGAMKEGKSKEFLQKAVDAYIAWFSKNRA
ncbi:MAG: NAD(P)H-dependent oxidoreductase [Flavihumibacter sp.]